MGENEFSTLWLKVSQIFDQIFSNLGLEVFLRLLCQWFFILETKQSTGTDIGLLKFVIIEINKAMALQVLL